MKLSIKNILKTRVSVIVFIVLLIIQFFGVMNQLKGIQKQNKSSFNLRI